MTTSNFKCLLISDFVLQNLSGYLKNPKDQIVVDSHMAPYDQVIQVLDNENMDVWQAECDYAVIWTQAQRILASFNDALQFRPVLVGEVLAEVDVFSQLVLQTQTRVKAIFIPIWDVPFNSRGYGMMDLKDGIGISNLIMQMNLRLAHNFKDSKNIFLLDTQRWIKSIGHKAYNSKLWYMAKIPYSNDVFQEASRDIKSAILGINGDAHKIIVLDLDNTLWGGIIGDDGMENIRLGGHDQLGEAFVSFQRALKSLKNRGIVLGIASKNEEAVAFEAIDKHPEMVLRRNDFVGWRINWKDKAQNIVDLITELNLGLQSVVFIDDNPVERERVREALPEVFVPQWPKDPMQYSKALMNIRGFDTPILTVEDSKKTEMYKSESLRKSHQTMVGSIDDWLKSLEMEVSIESLNDINLSRTTQLLNKTNQMNLSTRRLQEDELVKWNAQKEHEMWLFRISDKFGDSGLTGIVSLKTEGKIGYLVDYLLSCRIVGRKVEELMLATVIQFAKEKGLEKVCARYLSTVKNKPCFNFFKGSGFQYIENKNIFEWDIKTDFLFPDSIKVTGSAIREYVTRRID